MLKLDNRVVHGALQSLALLTRGMTLGVRGIAVDAQNRVCLVRHTYTKGWYLPGGGIEPRETAEAAMAREFREEAEIILDPGAPLQLHGFFLNDSAWRRDHVAVYVAPAFTVRGVKRPNREIAECAFFPLDALPPDLTRGNAARLVEWREGRRPDERWL